MQCQFRVLREWFIYFSFQKVVKQFLDFNRSNTQCKSLSKYFRLFSHFFHWMIWSLLDDNRKEWETHGRGFGRQVKWTLAIGSYWMPEAILVTLKDSLSDWPLANIYLEKVSGDSFAEFDDYCWFRDMFQSKSERVCKKLFFINAISFA